MLILRSCDNSSVGSVVLVNITLNTAIVANYTGTTVGSRACDENSECELNKTSLLKASVKVMGCGVKVPLVYVWYVVIH